MSNEEQKQSRPLLAYKNEAFLDRGEARSIRILSEYLQPLSQFRRENLHDTVVFFGSARIVETGQMSRFYHEARELAKHVTAWSDSLPDASRRFVVTTGGGPGIMEAANRGAADAGGKTMGLNIALPFEQFPNPYISPELNFEFHYFFMRKFWFAYLAKALVVFPGGFGTLDELSEILCLMQTQKLEKKMLILLYGRDFWHRVLNFQALVDTGMINASDLELFHWADDPVTAFNIMREFLTAHYLEGPDALKPSETLTPAIAKSRV